MLRILTLLVLIATAMAGVVVYSSPEYPLASGYEYEHTVQTPDYVNHASVSSPLNGFAASPVLLRSVYRQPVAYTSLW